MDRNIVNYNRQLNKYAQLDQMGVQMELFLFGGDNDLTEVPWNEVWPLKNVIYVKDLLKKLTDYVKMIYIILQILVRCAMLFMCKANLAIQSTKKNKLNIYIYIICTELVLFKSSFLLILPSDLFFLTHFDIEKDQLPLNISYFSELNFKFKFTFYNKSLNVVIFLLTQTEESLRAKGRGMQK